MIPRHPRPPVEEVYAPWEGEGKSGKRGVRSARPIRTASYLGLRRLPILLAIHPFAHQLERLERNLLAGLEPLLDLDVRVAGISEDDLAPFEPAVGLLHRDVVLAVGMKHGLDRHREGILVLGDQDLGPGGHPRAETPEALVELDPGRDRPSGCPVEG